MYSKEKTWLIRRAEPSERDLIKNHVYHVHLTSSARNASELESQTKDLPTDFPSLISDEFFNHPANHHWIAIDKDNSVVGTAGLIDDDKSETTQTCLKYLFVSQEYRNQGIGSALLRTVIEDATNRGKKSIRLLTLREVYDTALALYLKYGFIIENEFMGGTYICVDMIKYL